jgi:putative aldouronate transport system permease protein
MQRIADLMKYALILVASFPVTVLYPFLQRYFVKGVMIGAIKG